MRGDGAGIQVQVGSTAHDRALGPCAARGDRHAIGACGGAQRRAGSAAKRHQALRFRAFGGDRAAVQRYRAAMHGEHPGGPFASRCQGHVMGHHRGTR
ncbi:hypothetical protein D3C87_1202730 [compost metagenome]